MELLQLINVVGRGLDVIVLASCFLVLRLYLPSALSKPRQAAPQDWLITGIAISFASKTLDTIYWGFFWGAYLFNPVWVNNTGLVAYGPLVVLVMRQVGTIISAGCHTMAFYLASHQVKPDGSRVHIRRSVAASCAGGFFIVLCIWTSILYWI